MDMTAIIMTVLIVGGVGLLIGIFLGIAGVWFKVEVDEREEAVLAALPGNNCGGCGYPGCSGLAAAIVKGEAEVSACLVGGEAVASKVAEIMGVEAIEGARRTAFIKCGGCADKTTENYEYSGVKDCTMVSFTPGGGSKTCRYGCLGYGTCASVCPFDAIYIENGLAVVDKDACKACGKCVSECPKHLIELIPYDSKYAVACSSKDKGPVVMKACQVGCIACQLCKKQCEYDAITVKDMIAYIDQEKCVKCGACIGKCPKKTIVERL